MAIKSFEQVLGACPFFRGLLPEQLATLAGCAANVRFAGGEYLFREDQPADQFYLIRRGRVAVEVFVPGTGAITIETIEEGEVVGYAWLFPSHVSRFDTRALTVVRALALDGRCLRAKGEKDPALGYALATRFAQLVLDRLEATRVQLMDLYGSHASR